MISSRRALVAALLALAAGAATAADTVVRGSGNSVTQARDPGSFSGIALGGPFEVVLRQAAREAVEVRADDNVVPWVETTIESSGGRRSLHIDLKRGARLAEGTRVVVTVDVVRLDSVALGGSGRIDGSGLRSDALAVALGGSGTIRLAALDAARLEVSIGGSGTFEADGAARRIDLRIGGSGSMQAARLASQEVHASIAGSGNARLHADATLEVSIAGSGDVIYSGNAQPRVAVAGSGTVRKAS